MKIPALLVLVWIPCAGCIIHIGGDGWDDGHRGGIGLRAWGDGPTVQGNGQEALEERAVGDFDHLTVQGAFQVRVEIGSPTSVVVRGDQNLLSHVRTIERDGSLEVRQQRSLRPELPLSVEVRVPSLRALDVSGSSVVDLAGLEQEELALRASGSSVLRAEGRADRLSADCSGSCRLELDRLVAGSARVELSGSCRAELRVEGELSIDSSGSSEVVYRGGGRLGAVEIDGSARIQRGDD